MYITFSHGKTWCVGTVLAALVAMLLASCGGGGDGPAIKAYAQTIRFSSAPSLTLNGTASVSATSSTGLAVSYSTITPSVCLINGSTGLVTAIAAGSCIVAADQSGNDVFAPAPQVTQSITVIFNPSQTISFGAAPALTLYGTASVSAVASSGLAVSYSSATPSICSVNSISGVITDIAAGTCTIAANQGGDAYYSAAPQTSQTLTVTGAVGVVTAPGTPTGVTATLGDTPDTVLVNFTGPVSSGGSPVTGYTVTSNPQGIAATGTAAPIAVTCPTTCAGYTFSVLATNMVGNSAASTPAAVLTSYKVVTTFLEPDTQPNNSIFIGSFAFNSSTGTVSNLQGILSESMTGNQMAYPNDNMTWLPLNFQLSSVNDSRLGGLLVTTFRLPGSNTFSTNPTFGGTDGWAPGSGFGLYYGFPTTATGIPNPGNVYVRIFVNTADPTATLTQAQIDKLAYADCAAGGMMGATCMTGTTVAGYGTVGSMSGYPVNQTISRQ